MVIPGLGWWILLPDGVFPQNTVQGFDEARDVGVGEYQWRLDLQHVTPWPIHADQDALFTESITHICRRLRSRRQRGSIANEFHANEKTETANIADDRVVRREFPESLPQVLAHVQRLVLQSLVLDH